MFRLITISCVACLAVLTSPTDAQCLEWSGGYGIPGNGLNASASCMVTFDDGSGPHLYVAGLFTQASGIPANGVARWNGSAWEAVGAGVRPVKSLVVFDADQNGPGPAQLYALGGFKIQQGAPSDHVARWNGSAWEAVPGLVVPQPVNAALVADEDGAGFLPTSLYLAYTIDPSNGNSFTVDRWDGSTLTPVGCSGYSQRSSPGVAHDPVRQRTVLYGGSGASGVLGDTWEFDGTHWAKVATTGPGIRAAPKLIFDSVRSRTLLVGGSGRTDTWEWNGLAWSQIAGDFGSTNRSSFQVVYDSARDRLVMYGGRLNNVILGDMWEFDGSSWSAATPAASPGLRSNYGLAYDSIRNRVVMFGGTDNISTFGDTWEYDGSTWTLMTTSGPGPRMDAQLAYNPLRGRVVLHGGSSGSSIQYDTWEWNGTSWTNIATAGPTDSLRSGPMTFDADAGAIRLFGTQGDTWSLAATTWSQVGGVFDGAVNTLTMHNEGAGPRLFVGGNFLRAGGGIQARSISRWTGSEWQNVGVGMASGIEALQSLGSTLYAGGTFTQLADSTQIRYLAGWNGTSWSKVGGVDPDGAVTALGAWNDGSGTALYASGVFTRIGTGFYTRAAKFLGGTWSPLSAGLNGSASAIHPFTDGSGSFLHFAGGFTLAGGQPASNFGQWGVPCTLPVIVIPPQNQTAQFPSSIVLSVTAQGAQPLSYQWRRNGVDLQNIPTHVLGAQSPTLQLLSWSLNDAGSYDVVVTNGLGSTTSSSAIVTVPGSVPGEPVDVSALVLTPSPITNVPGASLNAILDPLRLEDDRLAMLGGINSTAYNSVVLQDSQGIQSLARLDDPASGVPGYLFGDFNGRRFAVRGTGSDGLVTFTAHLSGAGIDASNASGIWVRTDSGTQLVAREGNQAAGVANGIRYDSLDLNNASGSTARCNTNGLLAYGGILVGTGVNSTNRNALWTWTSAGGSLLAARASQQAPGTTLNFTNFTNPQVNDLAQIAFLGGLTTMSFPSGVWAGPVGALQLLAKFGDPAVGVPGYTLSFPYEMTLANNGDVVFSSFVTNGVLTKTALYRWRSGQLQLWALDGQPAPGTDPTMNFQRPIAHAANGVGGFVFSTTLEPGCQGCQNSGLWLVDDQGIATIAIASPQQAPGAPSLFRFDQFNALSLRQPLVSLNDAGQVAFDARMTNGGIILRGVYGFTRESGLFPIIVPGTQVEIAPGLYRTAKEAYLTADPAHDGLSSDALSPSGKLFVRIWYDDGVSAVYSGQFQSFLRAYAPCPGDANNDRLVNAADLSVLLSQFGSSVTPNSGADLNGDGVVNAADLSVLLSSFGSDCG